MAEKKYDGGPAFPATSYYNERAVDTVPGMTLRDWFAGKTLQGMTAGTHSDPRAARSLTAVAERGGMAEVDIVATIAYEQADAMLRARKL